MRVHYDFSKAMRARDVPHLKKLQAEHGGKTRITILLDDGVIEQFRQRAEAAGSGYQTEINRALRAYLSEETLTLEAVRRVLREELHAT